MFDSSFGEFGKARSGLLLKKLPAGNAPISVPLGHAPDLFDPGNNILHESCPVQALRKSSSAFADQAMKSITVDISMTYWLSSKRLWPLA
jgi:hypothetical protein